MNRAQIVSRHIRPGADLRSVHWKSTARLGELVVREFDRTTRAESVVVWDGGAPFGVPERRGALTANPAVRRKKSRKARGGVRRDIAMEQGLRLTASLCRALTESGKPCALLRLDSEPVFIASPKKHSASVTGQFGDALAIADVSRGSALPEAMAVFLRNVPPGADVFLVTALDSEPLRRAVHALQRLGTAVTVIHVRINEKVPEGLDLRTVVLTPNDYADDEMAPVRNALVAALDPRPLRSDSRPGAAKPDEPSGISAEHGASASGVAIAAGAR